MRKRFFKRRFFYSFLITGAAGGLFLLLCLLFLQEFLPGLPPCGLHPLRQGKRLFALHENNSLARLFSRTGRNEYFSSSRNKHDRGGKNSSGLLPEQPDSSLFQGMKGEFSQHRPGFLLPVTLHCINPARAGPNS